jgi:hypothetical protein
VPFPYISKDDVHVTVDGVEVAFVWLSGGLVQTSVAPAVGSFVKIKRTTQKATALVDFEDASTLTESDLDLFSSQMLFIAQETSDALDNAITPNNEGQFDAKNKRIANLADPVDPQDAATKNYVDDGLASVADSVTAAQAAAATATTQAGIATTQATTATTQSTAAAASAADAADSAADAAASAANSLRASPVLSSREYAMTQDLSTFTRIETLSYYSNRPGGGATFHKVAAGTPFLDEFPMTGTIVGGSGYVNGTYYGVPLGGGTGIGLLGKVTVSGGAVTAVDIKTTKTGGYGVGNVLTTPNSFLGGSGTGFSFTIATLNTPTASFVDAAGNRWQYHPNTDYIHVDQFGAKADYVNADTGVTNNFWFIQNALFYAGNIGGTSQDAGGYQGDVVRLGHGSYLIGSDITLRTLTIPFGVILEGVRGSTLKITDVWDPAEHCINLGSPDTHAAQFGAGLRRLTVYFKRDIAVNSNIFMVYSNATQDGCAMDQVYLYCGNRGGVKYEIGYGGASTVRLDTVSVNFCGSNAALNVNIGTTIFDVRNLICGGPSSGTNTTNSVVVLRGSGGMYKFNGFHCEYNPTGFDILLTGTGMVSIKNATGGTGGTQLVLLNSGNTNGNVSLEQCAKNGSTTLVTNGQSGGTGRSADVMPKDGIVFFNP